MLDFPLPFRPVIELKLSSLRQLATASFAGVYSACFGGVYHPDMTVRTAYDLKPCEKLAKTTSDHKRGKAYVYYDLSDPHSGGMGDVADVVVDIEEGGGALQSRRSDAVVNNKFDRAGNGSPLSSRPALPSHPNPETLSPALAGTWVR